jgi:hypothetical protein
MSDLEYHRAASQAQAKYEAATAIARTDVARAPAWAAYQAEMKQIDAARVVVHLPTLF